MMSTGRESAGGNREEEMALPLKSSRVSNGVLHAASGARRAWEQYGAYVSICMSVRLSENKGGVCVGGGGHLPR